MFKRILVGHDLSDQSRHALVMAGGLAWAFASSITVLHVVPMPALLPRFGVSVAGQDLARYEGLVRRRIAQATEQLERRVRRAITPPLTSENLVVRAGDPIAAIVELADQWDADLVVVGRGKRGVLGPVSERVVRLSGRAVLVAPIKGRSSFGALIDLPGAKRGPARTRRLAAERAGAKRRT